MTQILTRWVLFYSKFNFKIVYRSCRANGKPDELFRRLNFPLRNNDSSSSDTPFTILRSENVLAITSLVTSLYDQILNAYNNDEFYSDTYNQLNTDKQNYYSKLQNFIFSNSFLLIKNKIIALSKCRFSLLNICHEISSTRYFDIK